MSNQFSGTKDVADNLAFSLDNLNSYLESACPDESTIIPSGISIFIEDNNFAAIVIPRSGLGAKKGLVCGNLLGLIDSDYQGPLSISLWNRSESEIVINPGERVAQLVVIRVNQVELDLVDEFTETERGNKGFGSTGVD